MKDPTNVRKMKLAQSRDFRCIQKSGIEPTEELKESLQVM